jgi:hypothetical protein
MTAKFGGMPMAHQTHAGALRHASATTRLGAALRFCDPLRSWDEASLSPQVRVHLTAR